MRDLLIELTGRGLPWCSGTSRAGRKKVGCTCKPEHCHARDSAYLVVIEVVALAEANVERVVAVFAHQLVQVLANVIHFY